MERHSIRYGGRGGRFGSLNLLLEARSWLWPPGGGPASSGWLGDPNGRILTALQLQLEWAIGGKRKKP